MKVKILIKYYQTAGLMVKEMVEKLYGENIDKDMTN